MFVSNRAGNLAAQTGFAFYVMDADGCTSDRSGRTEVYVMLADGTHVRRLTRR